MSDDHARSPSFSFTVHPSTDDFAVPYKTFLGMRKDQDLGYDYIGTGALVFRSSTPEKILLIQRAASDSMPNLWEIPGGACDADDDSILHGVARELWEETGLIAGICGPLVGGTQLFTSRSGRLIGKFNFVVRLEEGSKEKPDVKLDPKEHQKYVWATENEVRNEKMDADDLMICLTAPAQKAIILAGFEVKKNLDSIQS